MNYFGAGVYLLDYYYAHVVVSGNVCFPYCSEVFQEGNCFLKKVKSVVRLSWEEIERISVFQDFNEVFFLTLKIFLSFSRTPNNINDCESS